MTEAEVFGGAAETADGSDGAPSEAGTDPASWEPARQEMLREVLEGLERPTKELSPKFFYDHTGSELFEDITRLPEYYPTRTEEALLEACVPAWVTRLAPAALVELGAGSARKTRVLLDAMVAEGSGRVFVPVDLSGDFLRNTVLQVRREYPGLSVEPLVADIGEPLKLEDRLPGPVLFVLLGGTIGNFPDESGSRLLAGVGKAMGPGDRLVMGADLRPGGGKTVEEVEAAYNDASGVTAAFNLNLLRVLNRELGSDFRLDSFRHRAFYNAGAGRIEMHLVSQAPQSVRFGDGTTIPFAEGETVRTEISCKYDRESMAALLESAGLMVDEWAQDADDRFSLVLARPVEPGD